MSPELFNKVDAYIQSVSVEEDGFEASYIARVEESGLRKIHISASQGKFLYLLTKMIGAKRVLEIGTLGGYSAVWMARAIGASGELITLENEQKCVEFARETFRAQGVSERCKVIHGPALEILPTLEGEFDLVFIDAMKREYSEYLTHAVRLIRKGGLIIGDNVVRAGGVLPDQRKDNPSKGVAAYNQAVADHPNLEAVILQQVGPKGHDGLSIALVV